MRKNGKICYCQEARIPSGPVSRRPHEKPFRPAPGWERAHSCEYVAERNALIPSAERAADKAIRDVDSNDWTRVFHETMEELYRQRHMH